MSTPNAMQMREQMSMHDQKQVRAKSHEPGANRKDARALEADISHLRLRRKAASLTKEGAAFLKALDAR